MDWNLRTCARRGHVTYAPDEAPFRERLHATTPVGAAWRCLRCGDFVIGEPQAQGPAEDAPIVLRGRALRDALVLRLLSIERFAKGIAVLLAGYGVYRFRTHRDGVERAFNEDLPLLRPFADRIGWKFEDSAMIHTIRTVIEAESKTLLWVAIGLMVYGVLQVVEGVGLWMLKRWGEYFAVVATSLGLPVEIYELSEKVTWLRIGALVVNIVAVLYILLSKRLFGLRGGHAAYAAERHETSLIEVEIAASEPTLPKGLRNPKAPVAQGDDRPTELTSGGKRAGVV
ncbi:DUF2127 domain-containing protein [Dactylosporangium sp. NPDC050588]|uniref:DUF2127 domain-containing protein n=1 Tax=Dactylosporangium sp. NPDC050588 TaxID=3157211 RepID=UPI0033E66AA1